MTRQQYLMNQVTMIDLYLQFIKVVESDKKRDSILNEIRRLRYHISQIEDMTKTEKQLEMSFKEMTIESNMNISTQCTDENNK